MNRHKKVGLVTIGQSPRDDVVPEIKRLVGTVADILECGALDDLTLPEIKMLAPEEHDYLLVTRLRDGTKVRLARGKIMNYMQKCIDLLNEQGVDFILILCVGEWPKFRSHKPVIFPSEPFCGFVHGLTSIGNKLGIIVPAEEQFSHFKQKWAKKNIQIFVAAATAYGPTSKDENKRAAEILKEKNVDLVVMDCPGYTREVKRVVQQVTGKPVLQARSFIATTIRELSN